MLELLFEPFMVRALAAAIIVSLVTSTVGIFAVLRKSTFFGDAISHAALTGIALGLLLKLPPVLTALVFSSGIAITLPILGNRSKASNDALLGFALPFSLALGVILLSLIPGYKPDLMSYLFGNILSISMEGIVILLGLLIALVVLLRVKSRQLIATALDPVYAAVSGLPVGRYTIIHNLLLTAAIVPSISLVGIILVTALLAIPVNIAKIFARSLKELFILTPLIAVTATIAGVVLSVAGDLPTGPSIVLVLGGSFLLVSIVRKA